MRPNLPSLILIALTFITPNLALATPTIADPPPPFRIYDVDRREREMRRLIGQLAGTPALSRPDADAALGQLDDIERQERAARADAGGRLGVGTIRNVDAELNALSRRLGLREPSY